MEKFKITYENMGTTSYMVVTFPAEAKAVHYQLEMLTGNTIDHILPAHKRIVNGDVAVYYNITSKISLSRVLERKKLSKKELICFLEGAVTAIKEAEEYQLPLSGIAMEMEYIFVNPSNYSPDFVFLPIENPETKNLRELIIELVMQGKLETVNDNFIQTLLEAVNTDPHSIEKLEKYIVDFKEKNTAVQKLVSPEPIVDAVKMDHSLQQDPIKEPKAEVKTPETPQKKMPAVKKGKEKEKKVKKENSGEKKSGGMKKFLLPQVLIAAVLAAAYTSGVLDISNILPAVGCIALIEIVLFREAFVNPKSSNDKKEKNKKAPKQVKAPNAPKLPASQNGFQEVKKPEMNVPKTSSPDRGIEPLSEIKPEIKKIELPKQVQMPSFELNDGDEETIVMGEAEAVYALYLEYSENGMVSRIPLDKPSILLGRLSGQVDFAVANPKVGKVHAEVMFRNGKVFLKDLNSKNGVYINGNSARINSNTEYELNINDRFKLADSEFILRRS